MNLSRLTPALFTSVVAAGAHGADAPAEPRNRAFGAELLADADARTSLLGAGPTAGYDGHFFIASADGSSRLQIEGQAQFRYYVNISDEAPGFDELTTGFQARRTKLAFSGNVNDVFYKVNGAFSRSSGAFKLEDAYAGMKLGDGWKVRAGQFTEGFLREELVSSKRQLLVDRSMVNEVFNQDRSQAVEIAYSDEQWRGVFSLSDGFGSKNTDFGMSPADYSFTGRGEYLVAGDWKQFKDFTSRRGSEYATMLGGALHYEVAPDTGVAAEAKTLVYTVDLSVEGDGWNVFGAFVGSHVTDAGGVAGVEVNTYGVVAQGGVFVSDDWELFGRFDDFLNDSSVGDDFATVSFGVNNYIRGHALKLTVDAQIYLDDVAAAGGAIGANTGIGHLGNGTSDGEFVLRTQLQLLF